MNTETLDTLDTLSKNKYKYGFVTDIDTEKPQKGISEDIIKFISIKKKMVVHQVKNEVMFSCMRF